MWDLVSGATEIRRPCSIFSSKWLFFDCFVYGRGELLSPKAGSQNTAWVQLTFWTNLIYRISYQKLLKNSSKTPVWKNNVVNTDYDLASRRKGHFQLSLILEIFYYGFNVFYSGIHAIYLYFLCLQVRRWECQYLWHFFECVSCSLQYRSVYYSIHSTLSSRRKLILHGSRKGRKVYF